MRDLTVSSHVHPSILQEKRNSSSALNSQNNGHSNNNKTATNNHHDSMSQIEKFVAPLIHDHTHQLPLGIGKSAQISLPARVILSGGWSDTPPYCLERGGKIVNLAVSLNGECPITATAKIIEKKCR